MKKKSNGKSELARIFLKFLAPCWIFWLTATVQAQTPTILSAYGEFDSGTSNQFVDVTFSEDMNPASATAAANYSIAGYTIASAALFTNDLGIASNNLVILQLNQPLTNNFMLMVNNVSSISGAALAANTSVAGTLDPMSSIDITSPNIVPPASSSATVWHTGTTYYRKPGEYVVDANGQDIWNYQDGFRFVYTTRTNNFAIVVQVPWILPADAWSKAGLMARETIDPGDGGSRMVAVFTTPLASQLGLDGLYGEGSLSCAVRDTTDQGAYEPGDYLGDGVIAPSFPNQWLMLTRTTGGTNDLFTAYGSTNELNWTWLFNFSPVTNGADTPFPSVVDVGMCSSTDIYTNTTEDVTATYENFGDYINPFSVTSPLSVSVESGTSATFTAASSGATYLYNGATYPFVDYQWYTNGTAVDGATNSSYTTPLATTNLNDLSVYCAVTSTLGFAPGTTNTAKATLTVTPNPTPPTIVGVYGEYDSGTSNQFVDVTFAQAINPSSAANLANYSIAGSTITNATLFTNNLGAASTNQVILELASGLTGSFTLAVTNVQSFSGIPIAANTSVVDATLDPLSSIDITSPSAAMPSVWFTGTTYFLGQGSYMVDANGQDIWNNQDGFRFVYETRTNDFAVAVQVPWILPAATWSKAGLMAREQIDPSDGGSRMAALMTTAAASQIGLDGSAGEDSLTWQVRGTNDQGAYEPPDYVGDGAIAPSYPNQWLLLTRQTSASDFATNDLFACYSSTDKINWTWLGDWTPLTPGEPPFPSVVNVGMCSSTGWSDSFTNNDAFVTVLYQDFGDYADQVFVTHSPQSVSAASGTSATFSVVAGSDATLTKYGTTGPFLFYQWYTNSVAAPGATASTYTTPLLTTNLNGMPVYCAITAVGFSSTTKSATATLTVTANATAPTLVIVDGVYDSVTGDQYVYVTLNEAANVALLANPTSYVIAGYSVTAVTLITNEQGSVDATAVILQIDKPLSNSFTLDVNGLQSFSGIPIAANTADVGVIATNANFYGVGLNWTLNNNSDQPAIADNVLTLTTNGPNEASSAFFNTPQSIGSFTASYTYIAGGDKGADGTTFCMENDPAGASALGGTGGDLGFNGITNSAAFEINLYTGSIGGEGIQFGTNGATPDVGGFNGNPTAPPAAPYSKPGLVNPASGDPINVQIAYSQNVFSVTLLDTTTGQSFSTNYSVDLHSLLGDTNTAYVGFTSGDGDSYSTQQVVNFSFTPGAVAVVGPPLTIATGASGTFLIAWPSTTASSYVLQQSSRLAGPWANVTTTPTQANGNYQVSVTATAGAQFFRLVSP
ncbi:MAG TPA: L-type lectin-domain containing protein [Candidatus Baltobacteraceae bacterium]|jgi:hypothetical protein|nr:L-type lectin-domain containing protein [Candidatus Baltobacteraceae bacterium]